MSQSRNCTRTIITYLALVCDCSYPELWAIIQAQISSNPKKWLMKATEGGHLELMQYAVAQCAISQIILTTNDWDFYMAVAASKGHLEIVQYAAIQGGHDWKWCMEWATEGGHLEIVQYAATHRVWDWSSCMASAAKNGHLHIVQHAIAQQQEANLDFCMARAAAGGHLHIVQYATALGATNWDMCMAEAIKEDHHEFDQDRISIVNYLEQCKSQDFQK